MADSIIRNNKADMIALGRSLWPISATNKAKSGSVRVYPPLHRLLLGRIHAVFQLELGGCVVNPE